MKRVVLTILATAAIAAAPSLTLAQPAMSPAVAKVAATRNIACPKTISASVAIPSGFARIDNNGPGLKLIGMSVDGGQLSCQYGSIYLTNPSAKNCKRGPGAWDQNGNCFFPPPGTYFGGDPTCYATCD